MAKIILGIATAVLAVMIAFASAAQACISCNFVPPAVHTPSKPYGVKVYRKKHFYTAAKIRKARPSKKHIAERKTTAKKVATVNTAPIKTDAENENSTISTASLDKSEIIDTEETPTDEPKVSRNVGCKKFFPTVGMTLTVPCE